VGTQIETRKIVQKAVDNRKPFRRGNISAKVYDIGDFISMGRLPASLTDVLTARHLDYPLYVVYSYATPIGWCNLYNEPNWLIPYVNYSVSTTHHQHLLRIMTSNSGFYLQFA